MKNKTILLSTLLVAMFSITLISGCKKEDKESCSDGVKNQNETAIDCGGSCAACPTCTDGIQNGNETGTDCGGNCAVCPSCFDRIQNQNETGIDCGGICGIDYGYDTANCTVLTRQKFIGQFSGPETCTTGSVNYTLTISEHPGNLLQVILSNIYNNNFTGTAIVSGTTFTLSLSTVSGLGDTAQGTGTLSGNTLTFTYTVNFASGGSNTCTFTRTKL